MGRVSTQLDRRALSCSHQRFIFDHKIYSRKTGNKYLRWFVARTGVLHNTIAERVDADPFSSGYLDEAHNMVNHMLAISRSREGVRYTCFLCQLLFHLRPLTHGDNCSRKYCSRNITRPIRRKYYWIMKCLTVTCCFVAF